MDAKIAVVFAIGALVCATRAGAQGNAEQGRTKAAACLACHGADGNSAGPDWPKLAGQLPDYLSKQINDFKTGRRVNPTMSAMAQTLATQDVDDVAAFFATLKPSQGDVKQEGVAAGRQLFEKGKHRPAVAACMGCHGSKGEGNADWSKRLSKLPSVLAPALGGQQPVYVVAQLKAYQAGQRTNDPGGVMRNVASRLTEADMLAVSEYIASRQR